MSNLQELVMGINNYNHYSSSQYSGYLSITNTQQNNYGLSGVYGEHSGRGLDFPNYRVSQAFGFSIILVRRMICYLKDDGLKLVEVQCLESETITLSRPVSGLTGRFSRYGPV